MAKRNFEKLMAGYVKELTRKNEAMGEQYKISSYPRWDSDAHLGQLTFSKPGEKQVLIGTITEIGSFSLKSNSWMWAWANDSIPAPARLKAERFKELQELTGGKMFGEKHFDCDEYLAWELVAACVQHIGAIGGYRAPIDHLWRFMAIERFSS